MKRINYWLRNIFGFSKGEINGFGMLTLLLVLVVAAPFLFHHMAADTPRDMAADVRKLDSLVALMETSAEGEKDIEFRLVGAKPETLPLTAFDPNTLTLNQWQAMGVAKPLAQRIINYRQKGGRFRTKSDLLKIYSFPADVYARLSPYLLLPDSLSYAPKEYVSVREVKERTADPVKAEKTFTSFDLNMADSIQLMQVKGIGPAFSRRIIKYREKLGGFASESQLKEVYGLDSLVVQELLKLGTVSRDPVLQKLSLNHATAQELSAHPYISQKVASIMVDYRRQHGRYSSAEDLYKIRALDKATLDKLLPYLSFE